MRRTLVCSGLFAAMTVGMVVGQGPGAPPGPPIKSFRWEPANGPTLVVAGDMSMGIDARGVVTMNPQWMATGCKLQVLDVPPPDFVGPPYLRYFAGTARHDVRDPQDDYRTYSPTIDDNFNPVPLLQSWQYDIKLLLSGGPFNGNVQFTFKDVEVPGSAKRVGPAKK
jgi:hypothetical protein